MDRNRIGRGVVLGLVAAASAIGGLLLVLILILNNTPAGTALANQLLAGLVPDGQTALAARDVRGNWLARLEVIDLRLTRGNTVLAAADTVIIRARPWTLLRGRADIGSVNAAGLFVSGRPAGSSRGDGPAPHQIVRVLHATGYDGPPIRIGRVLVRDGRYSPAAGTALTHIALDARDLELSDGVAVSLDRLSARYSPASPDSAAVELWLSGALSRAGVEVDSLRLRGPQSDVSGTAVLPFGSDGGLGAVSLQLRAQPVELADLGAIPGLPPMNGRVRADASLSGTGIHAINGTVRVEWDRADFSLLSLGATRIDAAFAGGNLDVTARTVAEDDTVNARMRMVEPGVGAGGVRIEGTATAAAARIDLAARLPRGREAPEGAWWELERLSFDHVDLAQWIGGAPETDLSGAMEGRGRGFDPTTLSATTTWRLGESRVAGARVASASGRAAFEGLRAGTSLRVTTAAGEVAADTVMFSFDPANGVLNVSAALATDAGRARLKAALTPAPEGLDLVVDDGRFDDVDAGAWWPSLPPTRLGGAFSARATLTGPSAPSGFAAVRIDPSPVAGRTRVEGSVTATLDGGRLNAEGEIDIGGERVTVDADARVEGGRVRGRARAVVPFTLLAALAGRDTLPANGSLAVEAGFAQRNGAPAEVSVRATGHGRAGTCGVDSVLAILHVQDGAAVVDTLHVHSDAATVDAGGRLDLAATRGGGSTNFVATVRVDDPRTLLAVTGAAPSAFVLHHAEGANARIALRGDSLRADLGAGFSDERRVAATLVAQRDSSAVRITVTEGRMEAGDARWQLVGPALLRLAPDRIQVDRLEIGDAATENARVSARGILDRRGEQDFRIDVAGLPLDAVARSFGREVIEGLLDATLLLSGPAQAPRAEGTARFVPALAAAGAGATDATVRWDGRMVEWLAALTSSEGDSLSVSGRYPLALPLAVAAPDAAAPAGEMGLRIDARRFPLSALQPLFPNRIGARVGGTLDADIRFEESEKSLGSGRVAITDGELDLPTAGVRWENVQLDAVLAGDRVNLRRFTLHSRDGGLSIGGDVRIAAAGVETDLQILADHFVFVDRPGTRLVATGDVELTGRPGAPVVRGRLTLTDCTYFLPHGTLRGMQGEEDVVLTPADEEMLRATFGYEVAGPRGRPGRLLDRADVDLQVTLLRDNWLRKRAAPRLALELDGDVRVRAFPGGETMLNGRITPVPRRGYIESLGRTFDLAGGDVVLNGRKEDHVVDVRAEYKVRPPRLSDDPDVVVTLHVRGHPDDLTLSLTSEPPLAEHEIVSYITTGRNPLAPQTEADRNRNEGLALAAEIGLSRITSGLEDAAQEKIGLDVLQVRYEAILGASLVAGRYMNPRLYLGLQQPLQYRTSTSTQDPYQTSVELEYELNRWLVVNLQGERSLLRSFLRARYEY